MCRNVLDKLCYYAHMFKTIRYILTIILLVIVICILFKLITWVWPTQTTTVNLNQSSVVLQIKALNRLETASFTIEKIIEAGTNGNAFQNILFGDKILLIAHADIIAGFDLSQMDEKSIVVDGSKLTVTLPAPQILLTRLDNQQTKVYDRKQGLLTSGNKDLESTARLQAEQSIRGAACAQDILGVASKNAAAQFKTTFLTAGFTDVQVIIPEGICK